MWRPEAKVSVLDSAFMLGDGVWEVGLRAGVGWGGVVGAARGVGWWALHLGGGRCTSGSLRQQG